jgi:hypothetical protein
LKKVSVDIVCEGGDCWVKVVARNPRALDLNSQVKILQGPWIARAMTA